MKRMSSFTNFSLQKNFNVTDYSHYVDHIIIHEQIHKGKQKKIQIEIHLKRLGNEEISKILKLRKDYYEQKKNIKGFPNIECTVFDNTDKTTFIVLYRSEPYFYLKLLKEEGSLPENTFNEILGCLNFSNEDKSIQKDALKKQIQVQDEKYSEERREKVRVLKLEIEGIESYSVSAIEKAAHRLIDENLEKLGRRVSLQSIVEKAKEWLIKDLQESHKLLHKELPELYGIEKFPTDLSKDLRFEFFCMLSVLNIAELKAFFNELKINESIGFTNDRKNRLIEQIIYDCYLQNFGQGWMVYKFGDGEQATQTVAGLLDFLSEQKENRCYILGKIINALTRYDSINVRYLFGMQLDFAIWKIFSAMNDVFTLDEFDCLIKKNSNISNNLLNGIMYLTEGNPPKALKMLPSVNGISGRKFSDIINKLIIKHPENEKFQLFVLKNILQYLEPQSIMFILENKGISDDSLLEAVKVLKNHFALDDFLTAILQSSRRKLKDTLEDEYSELLDSQNNSVCRPGF